MESVLAAVAGDAQFRQAKDRDSLSPSGADRRQDVLLVARPVQGRLIQHGCRQLGYVSWLEPPRLEDEVGLPLVQPQFQAHGILVRIYKPLDAGVEHPELLLQAIPRFLQTGQVARPLPSANDRHQQVFSSPCRQGSFLRWVMSIGSTMVQSPWIGNCSSKITSPMASTAPRPQRALPGIPLVPLPQPAHCFPAGDRVVPRSCGLPARR